MLAVDADEADAKTAVNVDLLIFLLLLFSLPICFSVLFANCQQIVLLLLLQQISFFGEKLCLHYKLISRTSKEQRRVIEGWGESHQTA